MAEDEIFYKKLLDHLNDGIYFVDQNRKITFWNQGAERITGFKASEVTKSYCFDNTLRHIDDQGRELCQQGCPLHLTLSDGEVREADLALHHREGHRVPVHLRIFPITDDMGRIIGAAEVFSNNQSKLDMIQRMKELEEMSMLDSLTGLPNRRYIEIFMNQKIEFFKRYGFPFGILFMDIDHFKDINDRFGHRFGDEVLKMIGRTFLNNVRQTDLIGRWGGEEFIGVFSLSQSKKLRRIGKKFLHLVQNSGIRAGKKSMGVSISIGAALIRPDEDALSLIDRADGLMYESKKKGRNRLTVDSGA